MVAMYDFFLKWFPGLYWFEVNTSPWFLEECFFNIPAIHLLGKIESCPNQDILLRRQRFDWLRKLISRREDKRLVLCVVHEKIKWGEVDFKYYHDFSHWGSEANASMKMLFTRTAVLSCYTRNLDTRAWTCCCFLQHLLPFWRKC